MDKFYEIQQRLNSGYWHRVGYAKTRQGAERYAKQFNTNTEVYPTRIVVRKFIEDTSE
jgi:hypothetical protein